jgi:hypothetical protein
MAHANRQPCAAESCKPWLCGSVLRTRTHVSTRVPMPEATQPGNSSQQQQATQTAPHVHVRRAAQQTSAHTSVHAGWSAANTAAQDVRAQADVCGTCVVTPAAAVGLHPHTPPRCNPHKTSAQRLSTTSGCVLACYTHKRAALPCPALQAKPETNFRHSSAVLPQDTSDAICW